MIRGSISITPRKAVLWLVFFVALLPFLPVPGFWITLASYIGLYSLVALGLVLLTGVGGITSFGQAAFVGLGAYTSAYLTINLGASPWLTLLAAAALTGVVALLIGLITMRLSGHLLAVATIAWGLALYYLFGNVDFLGKYDGLGGIPPLSVGPLVLSSSMAMYSVIWGAVALCLAVSHNLLNSRVGRAMRALKNGDTMAEAMGVNCGWMKVVVFNIAALFACLSGWLYAHFQRTVSPGPFGFNEGIEYLFMAVLGGVGYIWGAVAGAAATVVFKQMLQVLVPQEFGGSGSYEVIAFGIILVMVLQIAPGGLWSVVRARLSERHVGDPPPAAPPLSRRVIPARGEPLLQVRKVYKEFGGLVAVNGLSLEVGGGEIVGLIGPNGAGKSTSFNLLSGVLRPSTGSILFQGESISGRQPRDIVRLGISRTFQHVHLVPDMSVLENVAVGAHQRSESGAQRGVIASMLGMNRREEATLLHEAAMQLERVGLAEHMHSEAESLAMGQQRALEIARALCCDPVLLLLDEPAAGLRYREKQELAALLKRLRAKGISILLVEHDMDFIMGLTDRLVVMNFGEKIAEGSPEVVQACPVVAEAYLGTAV